MKYPKLTNEIKENIKMKEKQYKKQRLVKGLKIGMNSANRE